MQTSGIDGACAICCAQRERTVIEDTEAADVDPGLRALAERGGLPRRARHAADRPGRRGDRRAVHPPRRAARAHRARTHAGRHLRPQGRHVHRARPRPGRLPGVAGPLPGGARRVGGAVRGAVAGARGHQRRRSSTSSGRYVNAAAAKALRRPADAFDGRRVQDVLPARWATSDSFRQYVAVVENERDARVRDARALRRRRAVVPLRRLADARQRRAVVQRHHHAQERRAPAAGGRPPQGRVPRDAGARAAQPARADPPGQRGVAPAAGHRGAEALEPRGDRAPGAPHGAAAGRPAGRLAHHARPPRAAPRHQHAGRDDRGRRRDRAPAGRLAPPRARGRAAAGRAS